MDAIKPFNTDKSQFNYLTALQTSSEGKLFKWLLSFEAITLVVNL